MGRRSRTGCCRPPWSGSAASSSRCGMATGRWWRSSRRSSDGLLLWRPPVPRLSARGSTGRCCAQHPEPPSRAGPPDHDMTPDALRLRHRADGRLRPLRRLEADGAMMERSEILTAMGQPKLFGMRAAFDEIVTTAIKRFTSREGRWRSAHRRDRRETRPLDQVPDDDRQAAPGQGC